MSEHRIEPFAADDLDAVLKFWRAARVQAQPWLEARLGHSEDDDRRFFTSVLMPACELWCARDGAQPIGLLALRGEDIEQLHVDPRWHRLGVGSALLAQARRRSPMRLSLHTHQRNEGARLFYEHHGFRAVAFGISPAPEQEPDVHYLWHGMA